MKKLIIIGLFFAVNTISCQEIRKEKMIQQFILDLFDEKIPAKRVVDKYLEIKLDKENKLSINERKKVAVEIIEKTRNDEGFQDTWLIPNNKIRYIKYPEVYPYHKFKDLSKIEISGIEKINKNVYVLLDTNKENILQYFLINEKNDKIISFNLFVKAKDLGWFFSY